MSKKAEELEVYSISTAKTILTEEGLKDLKEQRDSLLEEIEINKVELQEARAQGDLSENAEYDAARDNQARLDHKLKEIEAILSNYQIIESTRKDIVLLGNTVTILDHESNEETTYKIVGSIEADPLNGKLSNVTPLATAIMEHKVGDVVLVEKVEQPYKVTILEIK